MVRTPAMLFLPFLVSFHLVWPGNCKVDNADSLTTLNNIQFAIASSQITWQKRADVVRSWWNVSEINGHVWLDKKMLQRRTDDPEERISLCETHITEEKYAWDDLARFVRTSRIIVDAYQLKLPNIRWIVKGDDDSYFSPYGIAAILSRYDHSIPLYIGGQSESHGQNSLMSHKMVFGGGGIAVSLPLAEALNRTLDKCLNLYQELLGSDQRIAACIAELGVHPTFERGFHQCDSHGSISGLLEAHFPQIFASLHHVHKLQSIFPKISDPVVALAKLSKFIRPDPIGFSQQTICFVEGIRNWTIALSWGYSLKIYGKHVRLAAVEQVERTFSTFDGLEFPHAYEIDTRRKVNMKELPCELPFAMYATDVRLREDGSVICTYERIHSLEEVKSCKALPSRIYKFNVIRPNVKKVLPVVNLRKECCQSMDIVEREGKEVIANLWIAECVALESPGSARLVLDF